MMYVDFRLLRGFTFLLLLLLLMSCKAKKSVTAAGTTGGSVSFTAAQAELINAAAADKPMRVFKINNRADSLLLRKQCSDVVPDPNDPILQRFVGRLYSTVRDSISLGVGIAAPQVGILRNIIWVQRFDKPDFPFEVYLNPKIVKYTDLKQDCPEGCLSVPDYRATTKTRAYAVLLEYDKLDGSHHTEMIEDFTAVIFQHEIDHLNGILFLDRL